ncbi:MAG: hypothetical protein ACYTGA_08065, partial [Planctomycetota bacterium]
MNGHITIMLISLLLCPLTAGLCHASIHDPNNFAAEVISYIEGTGVGSDIINTAPFNNPAMALGAPTIDTTGDNFDISPSMTVPAVSVYAPFRAFELVTVGKGGELVVKFNHPVADDINNPYGIDLIVFGNAQQNTGVGPWLNGDPTAFTINSSNVIAEPMVVSVSQDGLTWYAFDPNTGPMADTFAPTLGRVFDPEGADSSIGAWNEWWGEPTDATYPLDPSIISSDLNGLTVAEAAQLYGDSAGGTGFDLADGGVEWIQYVKFTGGAYQASEVDAVADVSACGDYKHPFPDGDINLDCIVDILDITLLAENWLNLCQGEEMDAGVG